MKIYFVRHGETDWNIEHKIQGRIDIGLNDTGRAQAQEMRDQLENLQLDAILTSPLSRAYETAKIISEAHPEVPLLPVPELIERNFGDFEGKDNHGDYYGLWQYDNKDILNGETPKDLESRVFPFLDKLRRDYEGKNILLVGHGGVGLVIESYFYGLPDDYNLLRYLTKNGELKVYSADES